MPDNRVVHERHVEQFHSALYREIRIHEDSGEFRVIYLATRPEAVYVLHAFQKKSQKTSRMDVSLAIKRLKTIPRSGGAE